VFGENQERERRASKLNKQSGEGGYVWEEEEMRVGDREGL